jgi:chromate transport protein ChrA
MFLFDFWSDFGIIVDILVFFVVYKLLRNSLAPSKSIAFITSLIITFLLVLPYEWFKYLLFVILVLGAAWVKLEPEKWF